MGVLGSRIDTLQKESTDTVNGKEKQTIPIQNAWRIRSKMKPWAQTKAWVLLVCKDSTKTREALINKAFSGLSFCNQLLQTHLFSDCQVVFCRPLYQVRENSTSSGVPGLPMNGSFLSGAESCAISLSVSAKSKRSKATPHNCGFPKTENVQPQKVRRIPKSACEANLN
mgnify:CR=1 FL=1